MLEEIKSLFYFANSKTKGVLCTFENLKIKLNLFKIIQIKFLN